MKLADNIIKSLEEGMWYKTQVSKVKESIGSKHIRNMVETANKKIQEMLDPEHDSPNPADEDSEVLLKECYEAMGQVRERLYKVKDAKSKKR